MSAQPVWSKPARDADGHDVTPGDYLTPGGQLRTVRTVEATVLIVEFQVKKGRQRVELGNAAARHWRRESPAVSRG